ncbi:hypothetical protein [Mesorhizobium xinjiangense]|uniref:hypothetical protein n=1 Tax=Mesorhizobium xinjiangense TaxID=2678685 RepID=UPI0012EE3530|nr:hypothetical protein [Mesorhizobium xinjiangense]
MAEKGEKADALPRREGVARVSALRLPDQVRRESDSAMAPGLRPAILPHNDHEIGQLGACRAKEGGQEDQLWLYSWAGLG